MTFEPMTETELLALQKLWASNLPPLADYDASVDEGSFKSSLGLPHHRRKRIDYVRMWMWVGLISLVFLFWFGVWYFL